MAEFTRGIVAEEYFEQAVKLADFDGNRFDLQFWLPAGFRVAMATIHGAQGCDGASIAIGDGTDIGRWGALANVDGHDIVELTADGDRIVRQRVRPTLTAQDVTPSARYTGGFTVRVYGQMLS